MGSSSLPGSFHSSGCCCRESRDGRVARRPLRRDALSRQRWSYAHLLPNERNLQRQWYHPRQLGALELSIAGDKTCLNAFALSDKRVVTVRERGPSFPGRGPAAPTPGRRGALASGQRSRVPGSRRRPGGTRASGASPGISSREKFFQGQAYLPWELSPFVVRIPKRTLRPR